MVLDIITTALIVIPMGLGMARGFLYIFMRFAGWIGGMAAAFFGTPMLRGYLARGPVGERVHSMLEDKFAPVTDQLPGGGADPAAGVNAGGSTLPGGAADGGDAGTGDLTGLAGSGGDAGLAGSGGDGFGLPAILGNLIGDAVTDTVDAMISSLEGLILTVLSFLLIVIAVRLLLIFVIRPLTRRRGRGSLPGKVAGLALGMVEGLLLAFLFLAALVPAQHMVSPETAASITQNLAFSYLAGPLYDGNLLLAIFGQVLGA